MPATIEYVPARAMRRRGVRFRVVVTFGLLALACVAMAYVTGKPLEAGCFTDLHGVTACWPAKPNDPNGIWFFLGMWPGGVAIGTAFLSFLATGRPW